MELCRHRAFEHRGSEDITHSVQSRQAGTRRGCFAELRITAERRDHCLLDGGHFGSRPRSRRAMCVWKVSLSLRACTACGRARRCAACWPARAGSPPRPICTPPSSRANRPGGSRRSVCRSTRISWTPRSARSLPATPRARSPPRTRQRRRPPPRTPAMRSTVCDGWFRAAVWCWISAPTALGSISCRTLRSKMATALWCRVCPPASPWKARSTTRMPFVYTPDRHMFDYLRRAGGPRPRGG